MAIGIEIYRRIFQCSNFFFFFFALKGKQFYLLDLEFASSHFIQQSICTHAVNKNENARNRIKMLDAGWRMIENMKMFVHLSCYYVSMLLFFFQLFQAGDKRNFKRYVLFIMPEHSEFEIRINGSDYDPNSKYL